MNKQIILIKIGGSVLEHEPVMHALCADLQLLVANGYQVIVVHGGGKAIDHALAVYQLQSQFLDGLRVTSPEAMKIIEMVLCGQINQQFVRQLNNVGVMTMSFSGAQNQLLLCDYLSHQHGCVGYIKSVNTHMLQNLLKTQTNLVPVIATLGVDAWGNALNINADTAAAALANALAVDQIIYLTDQDGIYDQNGAIWHFLSAQQLKNLIQKALVRDGMLVKVRAILASLQAGISKIRVANGKVQHVLADAILYHKQPGTLCVPNLGEHHAIEYP